MTILDMAGRNFRDGPKQDNADNCGMFMFTPSLMSACLLCSGVTQPLCSGVAVPVKQENTSSHIKHIKHTKHGQDRVMITTDITQAILVCIKTSWVIQMPCIQTGFVKMTYQ